MFAQHTFTQNVSINMHKLLHKIKRIPFFLGSCVVKGVDAVKSVASTSFTITDTYEVSFGKFTISV